MNVAITTDGWTATSQHATYIAVTAHFITPAWKLDSCVLACRGHGGSSSAEEHCKFMNSIMNEYGIDKSNVSAFVADTESSMGKFEGIVEQTMEVPWLGCIDHRLQLITKIAINDNIDSEGTMKACRDLVSAIMYSNQAVVALLQFQKSRINLPHRPLVLKRRCYNSLVVHF